MLLLLRSLLHNCMLEFLSTFSQPYVFFSEVQKISHYIIQGVKNEMYFKIGDQRFADIPSIIEFYKKHMLDSTNLLEPVSMDFLLMICAKRVFVFCARGRVSILRAKSYD